MTTFKQHPLFNNRYEIIKNLGAGNTSKVYLARDTLSPETLVAIKILKEEYLKRDFDSILSVQNEITILKNMDHPHVIRLISYGDDGQVLKPSGRIIERLVYLIMEFVPGGLLFDFCSKFGGLGEDVGRFFVHQLLDAVDHMHSLKVAHRDLKLENILIDSNLNLKVADFGFACYKSIDTLRSYRGTMTYMAPEIKERKVYKGT